MTTLKSIALELLQKYEESETSVIWECSGAIEESEKYLDAEVAKYRELIDKYAEQEPCEDAVSRQAIKKLKRHNLVEGQFVSLYDIEHLPSVQPKAKTGRWIPVSERLPQNGTHVLICCEDGFVTSDDYFCYGFDDFKDNVVAWMPLPEPYKAESGEKE